MRERVCGGGCGSSSSSEQQRAAAFRFNSVQSISWAKRRSIISATRCWQLTRGGVCLCLRTDCDELGLLVFMCLPLKVQTRAQTKAHTPNSQDQCDEIQFLMFFSWKNKRNCRGSPRRLLLRPQISSNYVLRQSLRTVLTTQLLAGLLPAAWTLWGCSFGLGGGRHSYSKSAGVSVKLMESDVE